MGRSGENFEEPLALNIQEARSETDTGARPARSFLGLKPAAMVGIEELVRNQQLFPLCYGQTAGSEQFCACHFIKRYIRTL
jgi:hypothetical protein